MRDALRVRGIVMDARYTFVTVVFEQEYHLLLLQARSMRMHCPTSLVNAIIVIDNSTTFVFLHL
jgi:hypothetical protein